MHLHDFKFGYGIFFITLSQLPFPLALFSMAKNDAIFPLIQPIYVTHARMIHDSKQHTTTTTTTTTATRSSLSNRIRKKLKNLFRLD